MKLRRIGYIVVFIFIIFIIGGLSVFAADSYNHGDVNGDGVIDKDDARLIAIYILNKNVSNANIISTEGDANGDGKVKINDIILILAGKASIPPLKFESEAVGLRVGDTTKLNYTAEYNDNMNWQSSNNEVATVDAFGNVNAIAPGISKIILTDKYNNKATTTVVVFNYNLADSYESNTLKYWIEMPNNNYIITRIWVKDAYDQMRIAMTNEVNSNIAPVKLFASFQLERTNEINVCINDPERDYKMYNVMNADRLLENEISKKGYQNKGMYAVNASPMVSTYWYDDAPCDWVGQAAIPVVINNGEVIRDSTNAKLYRRRATLGLTSDNVIKKYTFTDGSTDAKIATNKNTVQKMKNDGVKYTFADFGDLVSDYEIVNTETANNIRTAICQIDESNYILISSTLLSTDETTRASNGISLNKMATDMVSYGCKVGYNFDGGGSQVHYYMKNNNIYTWVRKNSVRSYDGRGLADILYFVEK